MDRFIWNETRLNTINERFMTRSPYEVMAWGFEQFGDELVMATGFGTSGIVLMHMMAGLNPDATIFYLDTDLLFPETHVLKDRLAAALGISFIAVEPALSLHEQEHTYGATLWKEAPNTCCFLRKVLPLKRFLADKSAWITGIRRDQALSRANTNVIEWDEANQLVKLNPLAHWSAQDVWTYIHLNELPYNELHDRGYPSIGCKPCTRAINPGEDQRAGRWAGRQKVECGIHLQPVAA